MVIIRRESGMNVQTAY